ncbi:hypothetical protein X975_14457, partial [Stegodyphus mimosarum]
MTEKQKNLFEDLGKPTLRGVRKCPKCGTYNGTRGLSCKNKACKLIFKVVKEKIKTSSTTDAVKINNNSNLQIYSVKFQDSSDELRCFVHLPIIEGIEALQDASEITVIKRSAAICYAKSCRKPLDDMCTITLNLNPCAHADLVVNCVAHAEPLNLKKMILNVLPISNEAQEEIWCLASKSDEYLIQRVTKSTFAIRCNPDDQHPLGFLHFSVFEPGKNSRKYRILCECQSEITKPFVPKEKNICIHFYICICAFASEARLLEEFKPLVQSVLSSKSSGISAGPIGMSENKAELKNLRDIFLDGDGLSPSPPKRKKNESKYAGTLYLLQENTSKSIRSQKKLNNNANKKQTLVPNDMLESISFEQWLASVTERINQTMHYQFTGSPEPLVFHVPQKFFDILQQRISAGSKKKRLPNTVVAFSRKDSLPLGIFSKYTWHITNILHVKQIFDTPIGNQLYSQPIRQGSNSHYSAVLLTYSANGGTKKE